jgi:hypothetical protein
MRALLLIPLLQLAGVAATLGLLRRWRLNPARRPSATRTWGRHLLLPLLPNLSLVALVLFLQQRGLLPYLRLFNPDVFWIARLCGALAGAWAILGSGLTLLAFRKSRNR